MYIIKYNYLFYQFTTLLFYLTASKFYTGSCIIHTPHKYKKKKKEEEEEETKKYRKKSNAKHASLKAGEK